MNLQEASKKDLIKEIIKRFKEDGYDILKSEANTKVLLELENNQNINFNIVLTFGEPDTLSDDKFKCSRCYEKKETKCFSFYKSRVDADGYLMRSNAVCNTCTFKINKRRSKTLKEASKNGEIPDMPTPGQVCPNCNRGWYGKWHRHHDDVKHKFIDWLCGDCNMSFHDQRTPKK